MAAEQPGAATGKDSHSKAADYSMGFTDRERHRGGLHKYPFSGISLPRVTDPEPFNALVGRFILLYLPDPAATLRKPSNQLRSDAVIAFMEPDFTVESRVYPGSIESHQ